MGWWGPLFFHCVTLKWWKIPTNIFFPAPGYCAEISRPRNDQTYLESLKKLVSLGFNLQGIQVSSKTGQSSKSSPWETLGGVSDLSLGSHDLGFELRPLAR